MSRFTTQYLGDVDESKDSDIVYLNVDVINNRTIDQGLGTDPLIRFSETRDTPIINDASKYYFSIIRFQMNGAGRDLPILIPQVQIGQPDPNLTVYSITLNANVVYDIPSVGLRTFNSSRQAFVQYISESSTAPTPQPPLTRQDLNSKYYYVYTFQRWVDLVNNAINNAYSALQTDFNTFWTSEGGASPAPAFTTKAPYLKWDSTSKLFTLYGDSYGFGGADRTSASNPTNNETFTLFFNSNMNGLLGNFSNQYLGEETNLGKDNQIVFQNKLGTNTYTYDGTDYYTCEQDYESISSLWSPIASLVFTTTLLPIIPEQVGTPVKFGESNIQVPFSSASAFQPIITDISLPLDSPADYRGLVQYNPSGEYRLTSMTSSRQEVRNIDVQVYFKNRLDGELYPITMFNLSSVSIKMMFRKKSYNKGY
jgi:hypothetical protein